MDSALGPVCRRRYRGPEAGVPATHARRPGDRHRQRAARMRSLRYHQPAGRPPCATATSSATSSPAPASAATSSPCCRRPRGLSDGRMQQVAREFNFAETTFVLPPEAGTRAGSASSRPPARCRSPAIPTSGPRSRWRRRACSARSTEPITVTFEELAGLVPVVIDHSEAGGLRCELRAPEPLSLGRTVPAARWRTPSRSHAEDDRDPHPPARGGFGRPAVPDGGAQGPGGAGARAARALAGSRRWPRTASSPDVHLYFRSGDEFDLRARMFAPLDGVPEDPATGSANCALGALLGTLDPAPSGTFRWRIAQGVEMGRPSVLEVRAEKRDGVGGGGVVRGRACS